MQQRCTIDLRAYGHGRMPQVMAGGLEGTPIPYVVYLQGNYAKASVHRTELVAGASRAK